MPESLTEIKTLDTSIGIAQSIISNTKTGEEKDAAKKLANLWRNVPEDDRRELALYVNKTLSAQMRNATTPTPRDLLQAFTRELSILSTEEKNSAGITLSELDTIKSNAEVLNIIKDTSRSARERLRQIIKKQFRACRHGILSGEEE